MEAKSKKEAEAEVEIWKHVCGFTLTAVVKCAIELKIADILESHGGAISLSDLSAAAGCSPSALRRVMRYLVHRGFFKQEEESTSSISYAHTPLSRMLLQNGGHNSNNSMAKLIVMESSPVMVAAWHRLSSSALINGGLTPFVAAHGEELWEYASKNPEFSKLVNEGMACHARQAVSAILGRYPEVFEGIGYLVDVGGGDGTSLRAIVKGCPWIRGINLDLPHVVAAVSRHDGDGVEHVGGSMFEQVPKADAVFIMGVLHDWGDEECIKILKNCKEAIPKETGKVIIVELVVGEGEEDRYNEVHLALDMTMLVCTDAGKERTIREWEYVVNGAGYSKYKVKNIDGFISVIEAYP